MRKRQQEEAPAAEPASRKRRSWAGPGLGCRGGAHGSPRAAPAHEWAFTAQQVDGRVVAGVIDINTLAILSVLVAEAGSVRGGDAWCAGGRGQPPAPSSGGGAGRRLSRGRARPLGQVGGQSPLAPTGAGGRGWHGAQLARRDRKSVV